MRISTWIAELFSPKAQELNLVGKINENELHEQASLRLISRGERSALEIDLLKTAVFYDGVRFFRRSLLSFTFNSQNILSVMPSKNDGF